MKTLTDEFVYQEILYLDPEWNNDPEFNKIMYPEKPTAQAPPVKAKSEKTFWKTLLLVILLYVVVLGLVYYKFILS